MARSRCRVGWWLFSARLFRPWCERCSTEGITSRWAALEERSLSVTITLGTAPVPLRSRRKKRPAAALVRRFWTRMSSTLPSWPTARRRYFRSPSIVTRTSSRRHLPPGRGRRRRSALACVGMHWRRPCPYFAHQRQMLCHATTGAHTASESDTAPPLRRSASAPDSPDPRLCHRGPRHLVLTRATLVSDLSPFAQKSARPSPLVSAMTGRNRVGRPSRRSGPASAATAGAVSASQVRNRSTASR